MRRALVVDDSTSTRKVLRHYLQELNFEVLEAETREEMLYACASSVPDLVLLDGQMPDCDGLTLLGEFHALPAAEHAKVLYYTSEFDPVLIARALRSGADRHFLKPFDKDHLLRALGSVEML
ncbi:response regulator receiver protein [Faunimonas pinastri]|uniref:Response regulator receiver protein n=1 Tax=Faunimonas pinastri TaxID=1855383 RepID=A0A1H8ZBZ2_9HYPH|nr:response regulator [Faunimonas pinastri]SEP61188.1 response regulator receiver protein [Faunimonas pinastri]